MSSTTGFGMCWLSLAGLGQFSGSKPALLKRKLTRSVTSAPTPNQYFDLSKSNSICLYGFTPLACSSGVSGIGTGLYVPMTSMGTESLAVLAWATTILYKGWCLLPNLASLILSGGLGIMVGLVVVVCW